MNSRTSWMQQISQNKLLIALTIFLIAFPFIVGWLTDSSPVGVARGDRMVMRGESVRWQAVLIEVYIVGILTMSYNLLFGFTGIVSFGHALFFGMGSYVLGLALEYTGMDPGVGLVVGVVAGLIVACVLGVLIGLVSLRLRGVYFAIFTLAIAEMFFIFFGRLPLTKAEDGFAVSHLPVWLDPSQNRLTFYYIALAFFAGTYLFIRRLVNSPTGAVFQAIRENEDRALAIGYDTLRYKLLSLIVAGALAALAGMLQVILNKKVGPELLGVSNTVDPLLMTVIGGVGTFGGPIIGAAGLHLLDVFFRDSTLVIAGITVDIAGIWALLLGVVFIVVVLVFPLGVIGTWRRWRMRAARREPAAPLRQKAHPE